MGYSLNFKFRTINPHGSLPDGVTAKVLYFGIQWYIAYGNPLQSQVRSNMSDNNTDAAYYTYSPICGGGNDFEGRLGLHIAALFVILVTSAFGNFLFEFYSETHL